MEQADHDRARHGRHMVARRLASIATIMLAITGIQTALAIQRCDPDHRRAGSRRYRSSA